MLKVVGFVGAFLAIIVIGFVATVYLDRPVAEDQSTKEQSARAREMFAELCKTSGVRIHRTVNDVEGVVLLKVRSSKKEFDDQYSAVDPYGRDFEDDAYIISFLQGFRDGRNERPRFGYKFVDVVDGADGTRRRYTASWIVVGRKDETATNVRHALERDPTYDLNIYDFVLSSPMHSASSLQYGVLYEDISTREQRSNWIAGSSLRVIDLHTNEVIAERIGYMMDPLRGSRSGGRNPWLLAADYACPAFGGQRGAIGQIRQTAIFAEQVLKPSRAE